MLTTCEQAMTNILSTMRCFWYLKRHSWVLNCEENILNGPWETCVFPVDQCSSVKSLEHTTSVFQVRVFAISLFLHSKHLFFLIQKLHSTMWSLDEFYFTCLELNPYSKLLTTCLIILFIFSHHLGSFQKRFSTALQPHTSKVNPIIS